MNTQHFQVKAVDKVFKTSDKEVVALRDINPDTLEGQFVCLLGPSGCGKSSSMRWPVLHCPALAPSR